MNSEHLKLLEAHRRTWGSQRSNSLKNLYFEVDVGIEKRHARLSPIVSSRDSQYHSQYSPRVSPGHSPNRSPNLQAALSPSRGKGEELFGPTPSSSRRKTPLRASYPGPSPKLPPIDPFIYEQSPRSYKGTVSTAIHIPTETAAYHIPQESHIPTDSLHPSRKPLVPLVPPRKNPFIMTSTHQNEALQEHHLKCVSCRNFFDKVERIPRVMPCLHTLCSTCLKTRVRSEMIQCPSCNEVHDVPENNIYYLPEDNSRHHLVKAYKVQNRAQEIGCDSCDPRNRATHRCRECDQFLCGACMEAHKRTKVTKSHAVNSIDVLKRPNVSVQEYHHKQTCHLPNHEDQIFSYYCYSKGCDRPICSLCAIQEHKETEGHDVKSINDVYLENKRMVEGQMIDIRHKRNTADEAIGAIEDEVQNLYIKESSTDEEIDSAFLTCTKLLEKRKNELKEKLAATSKAKKKGLEIQLDRLIAEKNSLDHAFRFAGNTLTNSDATEFLQLKDPIIARLGDLKEREIDSRPHNKADIRFKADKLTDDFNSYVHKMGEVWSTTAFIPNTKVQTYDIGIGREETCMMITLHDYEKRPLAEPGVDMRVEITDPRGRKSLAPVLDCTHTEGAYKVLFQGSKIGDHRGSVFIQGMPVIDPGVAFKVRKPGALEADVIREYEEGGISKHNLFEDVQMTEQETEQKQGRVKAYRVFGDIICPDFSFDAATCHPQNTVSSDGKTLKNIKSRTTSVALGLKNYRGVISSKPFAKTGRYYFEVMVHFFIKRQLRQDLIFEVAIARKSEIDKHYTVDGSPFAWTVCARRCPLCRTICLQTWHNGQRKYHSKLTEAAPPGTTLRTTIGFLMDMKTKQWFIVDAKNRRLFYRFRDIDTGKPLWPVFGVYNADLASVALTLKTGRDIQAVPDIAPDA